VTVLVAVVAIGVGGGEGTVEIAAD
jgi:hypothetical protein